MLTGSDADPAGPGATSPAPTRNDVGGSVVVTSGMYSGQVGSSENSYAAIGPDGTLSSWGGATGSSIIQLVPGYGTGSASAGVVYY